MGIRSKLRKLRRRAQRIVQSARQPCLFPPGHFYSPIADIEDVRRRQDEIWKTPRDMPAIAWDDAPQLALLRTFEPHVAEIDFPIERPPDRAVYFYRNDQFPALDAEVLFCMLRNVRPARMIEIGSGYSSLVTAHVNRTFFGNRMHFSCVEPYPRKFLIEGVDGISELIVRRVEELPADHFSPLQRGDMLFIDSSHVTKVGSDVNYLFFEIIPRLKQGVLVHLHDIFLPDEYPKKWMIDEGRHWNEQYLVRAFLQFNAAFEVVWASHYMAENHAARVHDVFPRFPELGGGGSLWLRRVG